MECKRVAEVKACRGCGVSTTHRVRIEVGGVTGGVAEPRCPKCAGCGCGFVPLPR